MEHHVKRTLLFEYMLRIRRFEEIICEVYGAQDMKSPVHLSIGEEAVVVGVCTHLDDDDKVTASHRNHGVCLCRGMDPFHLFAECYGKISGCCGGKAGSMHCSSPEHGILGTSAIVGGGVPLALGNALAFKLRQGKGISVAFFGDGAFEEGSTTESLNFSALHKLPMLFVCTNNFYATVSPQRARQPDADIWRRAAPYMPAQLVDGVDVRAVSAAARKALAEIRAGNGPQFLECRAYRWKEHAGPLEDWTRGARPKSELEAWQARCPVRMEEKRLLEEKGMTPAEGKALAETLDETLYAALKQAQASPFPSPSELERNLFAE
jgi:pyruvate dehydrogenase E1 component alpha subunit